MISGIAEGRYNPTEKPSRKANGYRRKKLCTRGIRKAARPVSAREKTMDFLWPSIPEKRPEPISATPNPADMNMKMLLAAA
ncbi:MAG: hypothetical protein A4E57_02806 [Syntrophorhabdaceae bacterium PtaU1.Bin034]|nr:MAG: hypothetical protein A4E57_02806 [Syntrophorhabdaceae bacterium PtaU1.Bin034]